MTDKVVNYTDEMVARLHEVYDPQASDEVRQEQVKELAEELGRVPASIRAKLVREKLYVPLTKAPAKPKTPSKAVIVGVIAERLGVDEDVVGSLEKATKNTLIRIANALVKE
jgi:hypothetical protein